MKTDKLSEHLVKVLHVCDKSCIQRGEFFEQKNKLRTKALVPFKVFAHLCTLLLCLFCSSCLNSQNTPRLDEVYRNSSGYPQTYYTPLAMNTEGYTTSIEGYSVDDPGNDFFCKKGRYIKYEGNVSVSRIDFLKTFYSDLYQKSQRSFTKKYRYSCTKTMCAFLNEMYEHLHPGNKGYAWFLFCDNQKHELSDLTISPRKDNWLQVATPTDSILVRVSYSNIITGLDNKKFGISFRTY